MTNRTKLKIMELRLIDTGYFRADGGAMFGAIPKSAWRRRYPCDEENGCTLATRSLLVRTDEGRIILIDNGAGDKQLKQLSYYRFFGQVDLVEALNRIGIYREEVTDVVLTHLHFDHCGYTTQLDKRTGSLRPAFPNATHWVGRRQWENFLHPNALERDSYFPENMLAIAEAGQLRLVDANELLATDIELRLYDGHTPGQLVPYIYTPECTYVFAGDVIPLVACVSPEWISAYDTYPVTSYAEKLRLLEEAARERQVIIYCHDAYTRCSTVRKVDNFFRKDKTVKLISV